MSISTYSIASASRASILRIQNELRNAEKEQSDGRHADVGRTLGTATADAISFRTQATSLKAQLDANKLATSNMELMDDSLSTLVDSAEEMRKTILSLTSTADANTIRIAAEQARSQLEQMASVLNLSLGGRSYFGGDQISGAIVDAAAGSTATRGDFATYTGGLGRSGDALTEADMQAYLEPVAPATVSTFDALFGDAAWKATWSDASDAQMTAKISANETVTTSLSANQEAFRKIAAAYSMLADLDVGSMGKTARDVVLKKAQQTLQSGIDGVNGLKAEIGFRLGRIEAADKQVTLQMDIATEAFGRLEDVDPAEAALKITRLETQLEATYTVTGRLQGLNILNYL